MLRVCIRTELCEELDCSPSLQIQLGGSVIVIARFSFVPFS